MKNFIAFFALLALCGTASAQVPMTGAGIGNPGGAAAYQGPGDINGAPNNGYGLRGYNAAYTGKSIKACTAGDAACSDINIIAGGGLDTAALGSLGCNNTTTICTVSTVYDQPNQSGTPKDMVQATEANRPQLIIPGAANGCTTTANYCLHFISGSSVQSAGSVSSISVPFTISYVAFRGTGNMGTLVDTNDANETNLQSTAAVLISAFGSFSATVSASTWHASQNLSNGISSIIYVDGSNTNGSVITSLAFNGNIKMNSNDSYWVESWIWQGDKSTNNSSINTQQHSYWGF